MKTRRQRRTVPLTVEEVVHIAKSRGQIEVNPLKCRRDTATTAAFKAAKLGLLRKVRVNCGHFVFYPI